MISQEHLDILKQGVEVWNKWREKYPEIQPQINEAILNGVDLSEVNLSGTHITNSYFGGTKFIRANLSGVVMHRSTLNDADLSGAYLSEANFSGVNFTQANLFRANLTRTSLVRSIFRSANLCEANLNEAQLSGAEFFFANLGRATLTRADLSRAIFVGTNLTRANLTNCFIHGISCWDVEVEETKQLNLVITPSGQPAITVDNLKIAQFIYLVLNNEEIREVIDTITSKVVLILGRFTPERKVILDAIREALRKQNYLPILFDFEKPSSRDFTETVNILAHLSRFIIADISDPRSIPQELYAIVPHLAVPIRPLLYEPESEYSMFLDFGKYPWVLPVYQYKDPDSLLASLEGTIIEPAENRAKELALEKAKRLEKS